MTAFGIVVLAIAAILIAVLSPNGASAQTTNADGSTTIWSTTMTVGTDSTTAGAATDVTEGYDQTTGGGIGSIGSDQITYGGTNYSVTGLRVNEQTVSDTVSSDNLSLVMSPLFPTTSDTRLALELDGTRFHLSEATRGTQAYVWSNHGLTWADSDSVAVKLIELPTTSVWSTTMTVGTDSTTTGAATDVTEGYDQTIGGGIGSIGSNQITYGGTNYSVTGLRVNEQTVSGTVSSDNLSLVMSPLFPATSDTKLALELDGTRFHLSEATRGTQAYVWSNHSLTTWTQNQSVMVKLTTNDPGVSSIALTSDPNDDSHTGNDYTYAIGDDIEATITFNQAVDVTGSPQITLLIGSIEKAASCAAATNTTTVVCSYTVAQGDDAPDGVGVKANSLALNGGTIRRESSTTVNAFLGHTGVAVNASQKVDGIRLNADGSTTIWSTTMTVGTDSTTAGAATDVTEGYDQTTGGGIGSIGSDQITYGGTNYSVTGLRVNEQTVSDTVSSDNLSLVMSPLFPTTSDTRLALELDGTRFHLSEATRGTQAYVWSNHGLTWADSDSVAVKLIELPTTSVWSTTMTVGTDSTTAGAATDVTEGYDQTIGGGIGSIGSNQITYGGTNYSVTGLRVNEQTVSGTVSSDNLSLVMSPLFPATSDTKLALELDGTRFHLSEATRGTQAYVWSNHSLTTWTQNQSVMVKLTTNDPGVSSIALTSDPNDDSHTGNDYTYAIGDDIEATITFNQAVDVTGSPQITLLIGSIEKAASCAAATNTTTVVCSYTVAQGDDAPDGVGVKANSLALNGGTIRRESSTTVNAFLGHTGVAVNASQKVDGIRPAVTVSFELENYSVAEGDTVTVKVQLSEDPKREVVIPLTTTNQFGASSLDYSGVPSNVTFNSGQTENSFTFSAAQDTVDDDGESVKLGFGSLPALVTAGTRNEATVSITDDDDPAITVRFEQASYTVAEGGSVTVRVRLSVAPERTVVIPLTRTHRGGASSSDYSGVPASVTFQSGETEQSFTFTATQDTVDDDDESVRVGFSTLPAKVTAGTTPRATVSITDDDDPAVTVRFELADYSVAEGDTVRVKVQLNVAPERTVIIRLTTTNEAGASSSDYSGVPSSVTFQGGDTEKSFTFTAALDTVQDDAERVKLGFGALPARVTAGTRDEATVLITDDDAPAITVGFERADYPVAEGDNVAVRVKLNVNPERTVTIPLTTINQGGATSGDYSGVPSSVRFQSGETVRSFTFTAARDAVEDDGESVKLGFGTLPAKVTSGATDEATVSITDVEPVVSQPPAVSATADPTTVYPGEFVTLRGVATDPDGDPLTYLWTSDGGGDFTPFAATPQPAWFAPATETAYTANLTLTATDEHGLSASVTVSVVVEPFPQPNAATGLSSEVADDNSVSLAWTIPGQPRGVTIENVLVQQRNNRGAFETPTWDTVVTLTGPATFAGVPALAADRDFFFRIRLTSTHGLTADSRPLNVRTRTEETPAPQHFAAVWPTQTSITLDWFTVETAAEYKLEYRKDGETEWTRTSGDFDHLPSTSDHRDAFGVAAGLDCETDYDFRLSARGNGETRNDGRRYPSGSFGATATTSAQTGECAQEERVTNLLVSVEPRCATLTWTPPSGDRDTGYRVERYSYTGSHRSEPETLVEQLNRVANRYEDCSAEYRTDGAEHVYSVTALDNNPEPDEEGAFGTAYTSLLVFGPSREPEGPLNVLLTHDAQSSRRLAWDAPRDPWLTTVKTARAGSGPQQVVTDPWTTGYRVERREYRRTEGGGWFLPEVDDETLWSATMTVGESGGGTPGYNETFYGALTPTGFTHPSGSYRVAGLYGADPLVLSIAPNPPSDALEDWVLVIDGDPLLFKAGTIRPVPHLRVLLVTWVGQTLNWANGQQVSVQLVERARNDWEALRYGAVADTGTSFTDSEDKGDKQYVYRVWAYNDRGLSLYSWRGDWAFNGGDPGGDPEPAGYIPPPPAQQEGGETPSNTPPTGLPAISGTPQVGETLTADTSAIADEDGLTKMSYRYQWTAGGSDIDGATGSTHTLTSSEEGQTIQVQVTFTDDADNEETLTSAATGEVEARPNTPATGLPAISGTPQVEQTLTADTSGIEDDDGLDDATYRYQWIAGGSDIDGATGSTHTLTSSEEGQTIQVRVTFTDDAGTAASLTSAATAAVAALPTLTATFPVSPYQSARHNGAGDRPQVVVAFSLPVASFEKTTPSVPLTGATVSSVRRHEEDGLENAWIFFLDPDGNDDIVFRLVAGQPCDSGVICTGDGTPLSAAPEPRVLPGPEEEEDGPEPPPQEEEQEQAGDDQQTPQSPPPAPTSLTATVNAGGHIVLSWTAPDDDSITGYQILRRRPGEGESALLVYVADTRSTATTFTDTGVTAGVKHVYRVKAINAAGLSGWSNYVNPTP